jgi:hypothetical protein
MCNMCLQKIRSFQPVESWPKFMQRLVILNKHLNRSERIRAVCFLYGNGITDKNLIMCLLQNKLRDHSAKVHVNSIYNDILCNKYDNKWTYYNLLEKCILFLNGTISEDQEKISSYDLKCNIWNRYASKFSTTLEMQNKFLGEDELVCAKVNAAVKKE